MAVKMPRVEFASVVIAGVSLLVSAYVLVTQHLTNRRAYLEARWETIQRLNNQGKPDNVSRLVILNHGPALARDVDVRLTNAEGGDPHVRGMAQHALPIPELNADQDFHLPILLSLGSKLSAAELTWKDGRPGRQSSRVWLTRRTLI